MEKFKESLGHKTLFQASKISLRTFKTKYMAIPEENQLQAEKNSQTYKQSC